MVLHNILLKTIGDEFFLIQLHRYVGNIHSHIFYIKTYPIKLQKYNLCRVQCEESYDQTS